MRYKSAGLWAVIPALAALLAAGCEQEKKEEAAPEPVPAAGIEWKLAAAFPGDAPILGSSGKYFVQRLETITNGRIKVTFQEPGEPVPAFEIFDAVGGGTVEAGWSSAGNWTDKVPAAPLFSAFPFGPGSTEFLAWLYEGGGLDLWREIYARHNLFPIPCGVVPPEASGWFRTEVSSPRKLRGMKIRFYGIGRLALQKMGATVSLLAEGEEIAKALERGVLDGAEYEIPSTDERLGLARIAKHHYFPGWHQQSAIIELIVNLDKWNSLSPADQALFETVCRDVIVRSSAKGESMQGAALASFKKQGVRVHRWSAEFLNAFKKAHEEVVRELSAKDADFARVYRSYRAFRDDYREWFSLSRLPEKFR